MNIGIVGTGYVGLVSGVCLASKGHNVICVDLRKDIVNKLNSGIPHIYEKNLEKLLKSVLSKKLFSATDDLKHVLDNSDIILLAVGTPSQDGKIDLNQIESASKEIGKYIAVNDKFISIVVKSTVIPSTTDNFVKKIIENESGKKLGSFGVGMNPEFLREGEAVEDFMYPDRIVMGYEDNKTKSLLEKMYEPWSCDKLFVNSRTAEMIKYSNNTILACLISMNNELSNLASKIGGIDYLDVIEGVSLDKRWSPIIDNKRIKPTIMSYFTPGAGFGGSCFPKDVQAIRTQGESNGLEMLMTNSILTVNENQPRQVLHMLSKFPNAQKKVLLLGLSFKPGTDDIRESSSIKILKLILSKGYKVVATDPISIPNTKKEIIHKNLKFQSNWENEIESNDIIIVGTNWIEYIPLKEILKKINKNKLIIDCKRLFKSNEIKNHHYMTFGDNKL